MVFKTLKSTEKLVYSEHQEDLYEGEKYKLVYRMSNKYNIIIVINFLKINGKEKGRIVTFYKESAKRSEMVRRWLEKRR